MYIKRSNRKGTNLFMSEAIYYAGNILLIILPAALLLYAEIPFPCCSVNGSRSLFLSDHRYRHNP